MDELLNDKNTEQLHTVDNSDSDINTDTDTDSNNDEDNDNTEYAESLLNNLNDLVNTYDELEIKISLLNSQKKEFSKQMTNIKASIFDIMKQSKIDALQKKDRMLTIQTRKAPMTCKQLKNMLIDSKVVDDDYLAKIIKSNSHAIVTKDVLTIKKIRKKKINF
jgi:hypothetical protein